MSISHDALARRLRDAYTSGAIAPLRDGLEPTDAEGAYAVQNINTRQWLDTGRRIVGRKIGLTAKSVQVQLGVDRPDYGVLFADMEIANGGRLSPARVIQPKAEAEVALVMNRDICNPLATVRDVIAGTAFALPAIEIVDSRIRDWKISFADTVADNGSSAFFVLGTDPRRLEDLDLRTCGMVMEVDGTVASVGAGAACLGHPLEAAAWLARTLAAMGEGLKEGDVVLTGALGPMVALSPCARVRACIGGLGTCDFTFEEGI